MQMKLASFDIFDTALIRRCGKPENIFYLMAERLWPKNSAKQQEFFKLRVESGKLKKNSGEVMLEEVYDRLQITDYRLQIIESEKLVELEKEIERENLMVNPRVLEVIEQKRAEGWQIAFISDMYLDAEFLGGVLRDHGCMKEGDRLFVSSEWGARKDTGELYDVVRRELMPTEWCHWGDNRRSDVEMARRKGVMPTWVDTIYTDAECGDVLGGYQRAARIALGDNPFVRMAADFVAPAYVPYVLWLIGQRSTVNGQRSTVNSQRSTFSRQRLKDLRFNGQQTIGGSRRLYFLSRDSYVLMKGAEVLRDYYPNVELRYLFVSRKSLFLPYLACDVSAVQMLSVMDKRSLYGKSVDELLSLLATNRDELRGMAIEFAYKKIENRAIESDFLDKIFGGDYLPLLRERAEESKRVLLKYFEQEGLLSGDRCEMVDVGWLGTTRLMINRILDSVGAPRVKFYYYGVRGDVFGEECGEYETYFQAGELSTMATALVENYFSASPYPTAVGYVLQRGFDEVQGPVVPLFPEGKEYSETEITKANCDAVALLVKWVYEAGFSDEQLRCWAEEQLNKIIDLTVGIDLSPLAVASEFDKTSFVRKMSGKELVRFVCVGANITAFDKASLALTVGYKFMPCLWWLHGVSGRVRRFLYLKFKHNR